MSDWPPDSGTEKLCAELGLLISSTNESHLLWAFSMEKKYSLKKTIFMNGRNYLPLSPWCGCLWSAGGAAVTYCGWFYKSQFSVHGVVYLETLRNRTPFKSILPQSRYETQYNTQFFSWNTVYLGQNQV